MNSRLISVTEINSEVPHCSSCLKITETQISQKQHNQPHYFLCNLCDCQFLSKHELKSHECLEYQHLNKYILSRKNIKDNIKYITVGVSIDINNEISTYDPRFNRWYDKEFDILKRSRINTPSICYVAVLSPHSTFSTPSNYRYSGPYNYYVHEMQSIAPINDPFDLNQNCNVLSMFRVATPTEALEKLNVKYQLSVLVPWILVFVFLFLNNFF